VFNERVDNSFAGHLFFDWRNFDLPPQSCAPP
jgi:hypothetical protein